MGPITLFDKSFLQSLTLDESFWFDHFFLAHICPLFYVETLADLEKKPREGRAPEDEVRIIADKFPDNGAPSVHHSQLYRANMFGHPIPIDGRIVLAGGKNVREPGKEGVHFEPSPEADAFQRWQHQRFQDVERMYAKGWREEIQSVNLEETTRALKGWGLDGRKCKSLEEAARAARDFAFQLNGLGGLKLLFNLLGTPEKFREPLVDAWAGFGKVPLGEYAPYAAYVVSVEVFFHLAIAAKLIGEDPKKHRADIAYMLYLPFCFMFTSSDDLHRRCAPLFLRDDQRFVWGPELKQDLGELNAIYALLPEAERDKGVYTFAPTPPKDRHSLITDLWDRWMNENWRRPEEERVPKDIQDGVDLDEMIDVVNQSGEVIGTKRNPYVEPDFMTLKRHVRVKKGSWYQVPKSLEEGLENA